MSNKKKPNIGLHLSIKNGFKNALLEGEDAGCDCIQIFTGSNRTWNKKKITKKESEEFKKTYSKSIKIKEVVAHASYLINLGSPKKEIQKKSIDCFAEELKRCEQLSIKHLVLHPGSRLWSTEIKCLNQIAISIDIAISMSKSKTIILLENSSGQGTSVGHKFEQLAEIIQKSKYIKQLAACLDICHTFAAGYDIRSEASYEKTLESFESTIGLNKLKVIHINDSKTMHSSKIDRHATIGNGEIGLAPFKRLINDRRFLNIAKIFEPPSSTKPINIRKEMLFLTSL